MREYNTVMRSTRILVCALFAAALAGPTFAQRGPDLSPEDLSSAGSDAPMNRHRTPISDAELLLLFRNGYRFDAAGTLLSPGSDEPVTEGDYPFVMEEVRSSSRLKALMKISLILSRAGGSESLPPGDLKELRSIARSNWGVLSKKSRKELAQYFSKKEVWQLDQLIEKRGTAPSPTEPPDGVPEPRPMSPSPMDVMGGPMTPLGVRAAPPAPPAPAANAPPAPAAAAAAAAPRVAAVPAAALAAPKRPPLEAIVPLPAPWKTDPKPRPAKVPAPPEPQAEPAPVPLAPKAEPEPAPIPPVPKAEPEPAPVPPAPKAEPEPPTVPPAPKAVKEPEAVLPAPPPASATAADTPAPPDQVRALPAPWKKEEKPAATAPSWEAADVAPTNVAPSRIAYRSRARKGAVSSASGEIRPSDPGGPRHTELSPSMVVKPPVAPDAPPPTPPPPAVAAAPAPAAVPKAPPAAPKPAPLPEPPPLPPEALPAPPKPAAAPAAPKPKPKPRAPPKYPEFRADAFAAFLKEAPYGRDVKPLLSLLAKHAPASMRKTALGVVTTKLPHIVLDSRRAGSASRYAVSRLPHGPAAGRFQIALNDGPVLMETRRLFRKDLTFWLPDDPKVYSELGASVPAARAFSRESPSDSEAEGRWDTIRRYSDDSTRLRHSEAQLAGSLLRACFEIDAELKGWEDRFHSTLRAAAAEFAFYRSVEKATGLPPRLDRSLRAAYQEWLIRPEDYFDFMLVSGMGRGADRALMKGAGLLPKDAAPDSLDESFQPPASKTDSFRGWLRAEGRARSIK